ncbi:MAG: transcription termination factor Rho [Thermoguttaceae bacterium]|nr:transcription termination factor Rho [Thermoguttaceae bacterium]
MNRNDESSSRPRPRKTVDEFLDEMDAWDKIAAGIDDAESFDFDSNAEFPWSGRAKKSDAAPPADAENASRSDEPKPSRPGAYLVSYDDVDKIAEDYETRSKHREKSVWNRGEWNRDGRGDRRSNGNYRDGNYQNRDENGGFGGERGPRRYRQDGRDGGPNGDRRRDGRYQGRPDYSNRSNYRDGYRDRAPEAENGARGDYRGGRRDERRSNGPRYRDDYRENDRRDYYRDGGYPNDGPRRDFRRPPRRDYGAPNEDYRQDYRDDYRRFDDEPRDGGDYYSQRGPRRRRPDYYENLEPTVGALGKRGEPLSLAEELAARRGKPRYGNGRSDADANDAARLAAENEREADELAGATDEERQTIVELERLDARELVAEARRQNLETIDGERRRDLIVRVLRARLQKNGLMYGEGTLEILPDEFGFLRSANSRYLSCPDDIYISPSQIRRFGLRDGLTIFGQIRPPKERERYFALLRVETINDEDPNVLASKPFFDDLTPALPTERVDFGTDADLDLRLLDLIAPFGFGQRGLIASPPRAGKTTLLQKTAQAILANNPDVYVFVALIDERPEELTDLERRLRGPRCEVVGTTFDETSARHVQVAEIALEKAKRMVEYGRDVVVFLDSLTRLTRAWNVEFSAATLGAPTPGVLDPAATLRAKRYFGSARKVDGGGSLTILATARVDETGGLDDQILEEFKGAGNWEVWLDRSLAEKRVWPAIDVAKSGATGAESIVGDDEIERVGALRRRLATLDSVEAIRAMRDELAKTATNAEFIAGIDLKAT